MLIAILVAVGVIRAENTWGSYNTDDVATGLQVSFGSVHDHNLFVIHSFYNAICNKF